MKVLVSLIVAVVLWPTHAAAVDDFQPTESDATAKWSYPYKTDPEREKRIRDGVEVIIEEGIGSTSKMVEVLGAPDQVTDYRKGAQRLSERDGRMLTWNQQAARTPWVYRLVWYMTKDSPGHSADDIWFAAYLDHTGQVVMRLTRNNLQLNHPFPGE